MPTFHDSLDRLDDRFVAAGLQVVERMPRLVNDFLLGDTAVLEQARAMSMDVSDACREVEDGGFLLLARHQPVAGDLRRIVALLRMTVDVDRSAALLRHVCETVRIVDPRTLPTDLNEQLAELSDRAGDVFRGGMNAWRSRDALAVNELDDADEGVDRLQRLIVETAAERQDATEARLVLGLLARYLERIADHGVAIARDTAFAVAGERVQLPSRQAGTAHRDNG